MWNAHGFSLQRAIDEGLRINADQVLQKELIPTSVSTAGRSWQLEQLIFPMADEIRSDSQPQPLRVLYGQTTIPGLASRLHDSTRCVYC